MNKDKRKKTLKPTRSRAAVRNPKEGFKNLNRPEIKLHTENLRIVLRCSNATPIRARGNVGYCCYVCDCEFPLAADLKQHYIENHSYNDKPKRSVPYSNYFVKLDITGLCCKLCGLELDQLEKLIEHLIQDHGEPIYTQIKNLMVPFKFEKEELKCAVCAQDFYNFHTLLDHMRRHYRNFICDVCDEGYLNSNSLLMHKQRHAKGEYPCEECNKIFSSSSRLSYHKRIVHLGVKRNKCGFCGEKFAELIMKLNHMEKVHGINKPDFKCALCNKKFTCLKNLHGHRRAIHLLEKEHKCPQCGVAFFKKTTLNYHMAVHTGQREFQCAVCLKAYGRRTTLREHMRIHLGDRRFKCEYCSKTFTQKCSWKGHMRAKHGEEVL